MNHIYLSPHLDDAVYSCGGWIAQDVRHAENVEIWTIFAGDPASELTPFASELHARWGIGVEAVARRRAEDLAACKLLGIEPRHFSHSDCIYRRLSANGEPVIRVNEDLFKPVQPGEQALVLEIRNELLRLNPNGLTFHCPMAIGGHVDHRIVRAAAESTGLSLIYYADFPYSADPFLDLPAFIPPRSEPQEVEYMEDDLQKWMAGVAAYASQLSSFWPSTPAMQDAIRAYSLSTAGHTVWKCVAYRGVQ